MKHNESNITIRKRPYTVTRDLPHYVIGNDYKNLLRLSREWEHMVDRHSPSVRSQIMEQYISLYRRVYKENIF